MASSGPKKKIAILGGGVGALTTACYLTERPGWQDEVEITVYQMGWRLGGKGATGRDPERNQRIQEHGLHVWFGWYENAWRTLRGVYGELDRARGQVFSTVDEAFTPRDHVQMLEKVGDSWLPWNLDLPIRPGKPGETEVEPFGWDVLVTLVEWVIQWVDDLLEGHPDAVHPPPHGLGAWVLEELGKVAESVGDAARSSALHAAHLWMKALAPSAEEARSTGAHRRHHEAIAKLLRFFRDWLNERVDEAVAGDTELRRIWIVVDLSLTSVIGFLEDDVWSGGLGAIDDWECRDWLRHHGAAETSIDSTPVRALYDCFFGYKDGDVDQHFIAAGAGIGCVLRIGLTYSGSVLYEMNAGMGEVMVAPIYLVLARRGVRFEFFQKVTRIEPSEDGQSVERVHVDVQATVKEGKPYDPLFTVNDLPVWPDRPFYDQLEQGEELRRRHVDLESHWADWEPVEQRTLVAGSDFDVLVLGISLAGLGEICRPLGDADSSWREMLERIPSMQTFGVQLWFEKSLDEMGWQGPVRPAVAAPETMDVWADMSQTLDRECYDYRHMPRSVIYLCGPLIGDFLHRRPPGDRRVPEEAWDQVLDLAACWLERYPGWIWPRSVVPGSEGLDWQLLFVDGDATGLDRLKQQFLRANIDPTERYVLSPPKWNKLRKQPGESGFDNLVLAGDWTWNAVNAGCVEAATISGMLASRAISGHPEKIAGEHFLVG